MRVLLKRLDFQAEAQAARRRLAFPMNTALLV